MGISYTEREGTTEARPGSDLKVIQITDLGISAKVSREGTVVWVTHLSTGAPAAGATVEIRRSPQSGGSGAGPFVVDSSGVVT